MSIIVSVKIHDGIVMAADSATTFTFADGNRPPHIYEHANKIVNLVKGLPIGVMTCGSGGVGNASIATLLKDLREQLAGRDPAWRLDRDTYTMDVVASKVHAFFMEKARESGVKHDLVLRICGYSAGRPLSEAWEVRILQGACAAATCLQTEADIGPRWDGEGEALDRLLLGRSWRLVQGLVSLGVPQKQAEETCSELTPHLVETLILPAAPIQDAIDFARFMVETTKGFIRFAVVRAKTVGGPVEIAAITKHEGFKWVQRKHFFSVELNPSP